MSGFFDFTAGVTAAAGVICAGDSVIGAGSDAGGVIGVSIGVGSIDGVGGTGSVDGVVGAF
jgi:hypothetical protein